MEGEALELSRIIAAPIEKVWQVWTDPTEMTQWYAPETLTTPEAEVDLAVGGVYRIVMSGPDERHVAVGTFTAVEPLRTLSFTWRWEEDKQNTQVTVTLEEIEPGTTKVTLRHEGFADEMGVQRHTHGWRSTLNKLERHLI
ncbi:MAG: SRPBCC domain-containing protein [Candidatus Andersenbacteria bacterium CG10_big_fil_rev_8_21_14_0_10_54_11]|uniref:SRPBCC domain-containing protein n=1 Tax=Candidatus Andersenbacteria bacterium CG10_big_fil_rev_8_21_14_0_10_54_11 TaxID=1974485 RepID=A0A2M6WYM7_9BACT|nr:MAG: SRPBCC domain-containing protein [Candidatus Andersenbacteria bacterium CG10_big_fil_rev_8_21_14_0_10_54_11]